MWDRDMFKGVLGGMVLLGVFIGGGGVALIFGLAWLFIKLFGG